MTRRARVTPYIALLVASCASTSPNPPTTERRPVETTLYGETRTDEYAWLRDSDDPAVIAHLERENAYTDAVLASLKPLRETLYAEMRARIPEREVFPPEPDGRYEYFEKQEANLEYPIHLRRPLGGGPEEVVLDLNELSTGHDYYNVPHHAVSPDGRLVAFLEDTNGDDVAALRLRAIDGSSTREIHPEEVSAYSLAWSRDGTALYYTRPDETQRPCEVWRHRVGLDPSSDERLFREEDGRFWLDLRSSRSGEWIVVHAFSDDTSHIVVLSAADPGALPREVVAKRPGLRVVDIVHRRADGHAGWFYAVDDAEGARDGRLVRKAVDASFDTPWEVVVPEQERVQIRAFAAIRDWFVFEERRDGRRVVRLTRHDGSDEHIVPVTPNPGFSAFRLGPEYDRDTVGLLTSGPLSPFTVHRYAPETREATVLFQRKPAYDVDLFVADVLYGEAEDGVRIPVTYLRPKDAPADGSSPAVLTGYGALGVVYEPGHHVFREYAELLERGFTVAIAHPRGGGYYGRRWHDAGKLEHSAVTFSDFVAGAQALFDAGFTAPEELALVGGSAGGLLVGAAINLRPDLARVVVAQVPFVDCLNSMLDPTLPATTLDYPEYGNPAAEERYYRVIKSFAPYENVGAHDYPDIFATGGLNDARVAFWEPAKWVARLRDRRTDRDGLTLLRMALGAGHGGASGRSAALEARAEWQAFILDRIRPASSVDPGQRREKANE